MISILHNLENVERIPEALWESKINCYQNKVKLTAGKVEKIEFKFKQI